MINVAVLDDYQNVFTQIVDTNIYKDKFIFEIFKEPFSSEDETIVALENYEAIFIMRERTPITKSIINSLPKLKYIITSGMRNNAIDIDSAKKRNIILMTQEGKRNFLLSFSFSKRKYIGTGERRMNLRGSEDA